MPSVYFIGPKVPSIEYCTIAVSILCTSAFEAASGTTAAAAVAGGMPSIKYCTVAVSILCTFVVASICLQMSVMLSIEYCTIAVSPVHFLFHSYFVVAAIHSSIEYCTIAVSICLGSYCRHSAFDL